ncbi:MAG: cytochrome c3 family protein [Candidatus Zixiibacteriota bacterium]
MPIRNLQVFFLFLLSFGVIYVFAKPSPYELTVSESDIQFSHKLHVGENEIECDACHTAINTSELSADKNFPAMDDCGQCHDIEGEDNCGQCHKNADDPGALANPDRELVFNHKNHLDLDIDCRRCHINIEYSPRSRPENMPKMSLCFDCHDGSKAERECDLCHSDAQILSQIHPEQWLHEHGNRAASEPDWCNDCHGGQHFCLECHRGDNLSGEIHDLNYFFTHGLDAKSNEEDCRRCHDNKLFCVECHEKNQRMPLRHSTLAWLDEHGRFAREDVENCAACHESDDPTCARGGCHSDFDGLRGTDTRIHNADAPRFNFGGNWHGDESYFCYQCHISTGVPGNGFCGYCHGGKE